MRTWVGWVLSVQVRFVYVAMQHINHHTFTSTAVTSAYSLSHVELWVKKIEHGNRVRQYTSLLTLWMDKHYIDIRYLSQFCLYDTAVLHLVLSFLIFSWSELNIFPLTIQEFPKTFKLLIFLILNFEYILQIYLKWMFEKL